MLKILMIVPALGAVYGGPSLTAIGLAGALGRLGASVDVVTTNADGDQNQDVPLEEWIVHSGYRLRYFPRLHFSEFKVSLPLLRWLYNHLRDYDIVHGTSVFNFPALAYSSLAQLQGIPYVINPQGMLEPWALAHKAWKKKIYFQIIERPRLVTAAAIHCLTIHEAENVAALGLGTPLVIVPNGVSEEELESQSVDREPLFQQFPNLRKKTLVLFLHRVDPKKGLDILAPAFAEACRRLPELDLHLVVAGPPTDNFLPVAQGYFKTAGCSDRTTFTGMISGDVKRAALAAATVFVTPTYSEGFSMAVLEAMAAGLPSVLTTGCNFPEAGDVGAASVVEIDSAAFGAALIALLSDAARARAMGERARMFVRRFYSWEAAASRTIAIYQAILSHTPLPFTYSRRNADRAILNSPK